MRVARTEEAEIGVRERHRGSQNAIGLPLSFGDQGHVSPEVVSKNDVVRLADFLALDLP